MCKLAIASLVLLVGVNIVYGEAILEGAPQRRPVNLPIIKSYTERGFKKLSDEWVGPDKLVLAKVKSAYVRVEGVYITDVTILVGTCQKDKPESCESKALKELRECVITAVTYYGATDPANIAVSCSDKVIKNE